MSRFKDRKSVARGRSSKRYNPLFNDKGKSNRFSSCVRTIVAAARRRGHLVDALAAQKFAGHSQRMLDENQQDYQTPFGGKSVNGRLVHVNREEIVKGWDPILEDLVGESEYSKVLTALEQPNREKIGAKSPHQDWFKDLMHEKSEAVMSEKKPRGLLTERKHIEDACAIVADMIPRDSLSLLDIQEAIEGESGGANPVVYDASGMDTTTNSGLRWWESHWKPTDAMKPSKFARVTQVYESILQDVQDFDTMLRQGKVPQFLAVASHRLTSRGPEWRNPKRRRLVIAFNKPEPILWKRAIQPITDKAKFYEHNGVKPLAALNDLWMIDLDMQTMLRLAGAANQKVLSADFANYDATIPADMIELAADIWSSWFKDPQEKLYVRSLARATTSVILYTPNKVYGPGHNSMPSGSGLTNLGDSTVNLIIQWTGHVKGMYHINTTSVQGDDAVIQGDGITPEVFAQAAEIFGVVANPDKQFFEEGALMYLQRLHILGKPGGIASTYRTINAALSYERLSVMARQWNKYVDIARAIAQIENTAFWPGFPEFLDWFRTLDKFDLGSDLSAKEVMDRAGSVGRDAVLRDVISATKSGMANVDGFSRMVTNGALRGERLPPWGTDALFKRVYGTRLESQNTGLLSLRS